jgi:GTP-binding protein HflX
VLDRTAVILAIFQRHARSREARLQVEIARLAYIAPRLRETGGGQDRQGGGIGGRGAGESSHELDRRKVRDRIAELRAELASIERESGTRRKRRGGQNTVSLVGYTNAGKSSWMRALTGSGVLVEDKLFETLGTTVRALAPEGATRVLVSDTVGFIKHLPHDLVASFRSTHRRDRRTYRTVRTIAADHFDGILGTDAKNEWQRNEIEKGHAQTGPSTDTHHPRNPQQERPQRHQCIPQGAHSKED